MYRPSESFTNYSNKKAQWKAGKRQVDALTYYATQAKKKQEEVKVEKERQ
jgi:hypothetical protein